MDDGIPSSHLRPLMSVFKFAYNISIHKLDTDTLNSAQMGPDYYQILGVDKHASNDEIKKAYKNLVTIQNTK